MAQNLRQEGLLRQLSAVVRGVLKTPLLKKAASCLLSAELGSCIASIIGWSL